VDLRTRFLLALIELSRIDVSSAGVFMDEVPLGPCRDPGDPWWESEDCVILLEALLDAVAILGPDA
jgi:hypothetical protein